MLVKNKLDFILLFCLQHVGAIKFLLSENEFESVNQNEFSQLTSILATKLDEYRRCETILKEKFSLLAEARHKFDTFEKKYKDSLTYLSNRNDWLSLYLPILIIASTAFLLIRNYSQYVLVNEDENIENVNLLENVDQVAYANKKSLKLIDASNEMYVREAAMGHLIGNELNDCCMCMRSLDEIKQTMEIEDGEDVLSSQFKVTECGHVFCLSCMNKWFENRIYMASKNEFMCPVCMRNLMRDSVIHVSNVYI